MRYLTLVLIAWTLACTPLDLTVLVVDVNGDAAVSPANPGEFRITAKNNTDERIVWGMGSSTCQLSLSVIVESERGSERKLIDFGRVCTEDLGEQGLNPGETRTETVEWGGQILVCGMLAPLPDDAYQVIGAAGDRSQSAPLAVTVRSGATILLKCTT